MMNSPQSTTDAMPLAPLKPIKEIRLMERMIHLLAIGVPRSEIKRRIEKEGIKEGEIKAFKTFMGFIVSNHPNRKSDLQKNLWSEVNLNWPYYTEKEKLLAKNNKELVTAPALPKDRSTNSSSESEKTSNLMQASSCVKKSAPQKSEASTNLNYDAIEEPYCECPTCDPSEENNSSSEDAEDKKESFHRLGDFWYCKPPTSPEGIAYLERQARRRDMLLSMLKSMPTDPKTYHIRRKIRQRRSIV
ncbi:hypothetical protein TKK_0007359 [Trichogramma kaykai]